MIAMDVERPTGKLTEKALQKYAKQCRDVGVTGYWPDTAVQGLVARVRAKSTRFYFRYWFEGVRKEFPIGQHGALTIEQARDQAVALAGDIGKGIDPAVEKKQQRVRAHLNKESVLLIFLEGDYRKSTNEDNADKVTARIKKHFPHLLDLPMAKISAWQITKWRRKRI